jgi:hypothetical protein
MTATGITAEIHDSDGGDQNMGVQQSGQVGGLRNADLEYRGASASQLAFPHYELGAGGACAP